MIVPLYIMAGVIAFFYMTRGVYQEKDSLLYRAAKSDAKLEVMQDRGPIEMIGAIGDKFLDKIMDEDSSYVDDKTFADYTNKEISEQTEILQ